MKPSRQHIIHGKHELLVGRQHGLFISACLGCGQLLGAAKELRLVVMLDALHDCLGPVARMLSREHEPPQSLR